MVNLRSDLTSCERADAFRQLDQHEAAAKELGLAFADAEMLVGYGDDVAPGEPIASLQHHVNRIQSLIDRVLDLRVAPHGTVVTQRLQEADV